MSQLSHHFRNVHLQSLVDQNQELRRRITKLTEIQGYVQLLLDKLEKAEIKEKSLGNENAHLRQQVRQMEIKFANSENHHGDEMRYVFSQHDQLTQEKNMAIMQLKEALEKENAKVCQLESENRFQKTNEQKIVAEYEQALIKYRHRMGELEQDLQLIYKSLEEQKTHHDKINDTWAAESNQYKQALQQKDIVLSRLKDEINNLNLSKQKVERETDVLVDLNQKLEAQYRLAKQEMSNTIVNLKDKIHALEEKLMNKEHDCRDLQINVASLEKEVGELKVVQKGLKEDNQTYVTDNQRLIFLLEESDKQNLYLREKNRELQDYTVGQIQSLKLENLRIREQNNVLGRNNAQRETFLGTKLIQLKEANANKDNLKIYLEQAQGQLATLRAEVAAVQASLIQEKQYSTEVEINRKELSQTVKFLRQQNMNTDEMLKRIQRENIELSNQNHNLARLLSNPRQQNKDFVEQMDKIIKNFHIERQEQNHRHYIQKQKLKEMYEYDFKQKQMQLMREIASLQAELGRTNKLQILVERQRNKPTPVKSQYRTPLKN